MKAIPRASNFSRTRSAAGWPSRAWATRYVSLAAACHVVSGSYLNWDRIRLVSQAAVVLPSAT